ncbi:MAG: hypothetical protein RL097_700 [Candidatus Parcubacteria bacterium]
MYEAFVAAVRELWDFSLQSFQRKHKSSTAFKEHSGAVGPTIVSNRKNQQFLEIGYISRTQVDCFRVNERGDKVKVSTLHYGQKVLVLQKNEQEVEISRGNIQGWIATMSISSDPREVFPAFVSDSIYNEKNNTTTKLRACVQSYFLKKKVGVVHSDEFVLYKLIQDDFSFPEVFHSIEDGERWSEKLRKQITVDITTEPKTRSVMEYVSSTGVLQFGYVTAVRPDESIVIETIGCVVAGMYSIVTFTKEQWIHLQPTFITFH